MTAAELAYSDALAALRAGADLAWMRAMADWPMPCIAVRSSSEILRRSETL